ncbi:chitobiase/beta-hexosaminidase C-terminal domain-containing protein [Bacillus sp. ISL-47]|nr:chitobiase/beta-hexosaminidase C-terminal domain-containing protein [Bacillus sp. ISL-47]
MFSLVSIFALILSLFAPFSSAYADGTITVGEAIANNSGTATVEGYIVGTTKGTNSYQHEGPFSPATNIAIADSAAETDPSKIMPVQLPSGSIRTELNLVDNPENLGKKIQITGSLEAYFTGPGLKSPTSYTFAAETDPTQVSPVIASPEAGAIASGTPVTLSTSTEDAAIYYTIDGSEPTTASTEYSEPIIINEGTTIKAFAVKKGLDHSEISAFEYSIVQEQTIAEVRALPKESSVLTKGVVTAVLGSATYIQDETAGIVLYGLRLDVQPGDVVSASGKLTEYATLLEIEVQADDVKVIDSADVPEPEVLTAAQLDESKEATLVKIEKVSVQSFSGGNYTAVDEEGTSFQIRPDDSSLLTADTSYDSITGVLGAYNGTYQLIPRSAADVIADSTKVQQVTAAPGSGFVQSGDQVSLSTLTEDATIYYTTDGTDPTANSAVYSEPIAINKDTTINALAVKEGLTNSKVAVFNYIIQKEDVRIHDIQGAGHYSVYDGFHVTEVEGIITKVVDNHNFYMQDQEPDSDPKTSEGILVYKSKHGLTEGDVVSVNGLVKEWVLDGYSEKKETDLPVTEISATNVTKTGTDELPASVVIGEDRMPPTEVIDNDSFSEFDPEQDGIDFYESLEGMLVQVNNPKVVAPQKYGELAVVPGNVPTNTADGGLRITEDDFNPERIHIDMNNESFVAKMGDSFNGNIQGVVSYGFSNYKVLSDEAALPELVEGEVVREDTDIAPEEDKLTIASYNVENFSPKVDAEKVARLAEAIAKNMKQPDIIGLTEVQDNDGPTDSTTTDASQSAALLIEKIKELGGTEYTYTDIAPIDKMDGGQPGGNIRVGFLYNAERVSLMEGTKGEANEAVGFEDGKLTLNPGRIDPKNEAFEDSRKSLAAQFEFNGESVIVIANHFNSKGGDLPLFGKVQPPVLNSEIQRMKIANVISGFVKDVKEKDPNANIVLLGDFNDFEFSNPLQALKGQELTNMIEKVPAEERYSYSYQGNAQVLDHILVSNNLADRTKVDILHINSGFMEEHGRASDHDPVMIQTSLKEQVKPEEPKYDHVFNLVDYHAKKYVVGPYNALVTMDESSTLTEGLWLKKSATVTGEGLKNTRVAISSANKGAIIDLTGAEIKEVMIESNKVAEIRGAENVQKWTIGKKANPSGIKFTDSKGNAMHSPFEPKVNQAPVAAKTLENINAKTGQEVSLDLNEYFSDPDGDELSYTATIGAVNGSILTLPTETPETYLIAVTAKDGNGGEVTVRFSLTVEEAEQLEGYYEDASGKTGEELKAALHNIISEQTVISYSDVWDALKETDEDPANPDNVILFYTGESRSENLNGGNAGDWNREHVWAKSHGDFGTSMGPGTDVHHLRPTDVGINSARGNLDFDNGGTAVSGCDGCYKTASSWEPPDRVKGDVARMLFYMAVRYEGNGEVDLELNELLNNGSNPYHGKLSTLLEWHEQDPVDEFERNRNNIIFEKWQHNRNPFIDHPEWAEMIWEQAN